MEYTRIIHSRFCFCLSPFSCGLNSVLLSFHLLLTRTSVTHSWWRLIVPPHVLRGQSGLIHRRRVKLGVWPGASCLPRETLFPHLEDVGVAWNASEAPAAQPCLQGSGQAGAGGPVLCPLGLRSGLATWGRRMLRVGVIDWLQKWPQFFTCTPHPRLLQ